MRGQRTEALTQRLPETEAQMEIDLEQVRLERRGPRNPGCVLELGGCPEGCRRGGGREDAPATACPACPQVQDVQPITSYDAAGSFLLLGCANGSIYYVGEQRAPHVPENLPGKWEEGAGSLSALNEPTLLSPARPRRAEVSPAHEGQ